MDQRGGKRRRQALVRGGVAALLYCVVGAGAPGTALQAAALADIGSGGSILTQGGGARPRAMGGAFSAAAQDVNALFVNPAGLGELNHQEWMAEYRSLFAGISQSRLALVIPFTQVTAENVRNFGALAAHFGMQSYGTLESRDAAGAAQGEFSPAERLISLGYGKPVSGRIDLGGAVKLYSFEISGVQADGAAFDAGGLFKLVPGRWAVSVGAFNLGNDVHFAGEPEKLPQYVVGGIAFTPLPDRLLLAVDLVDPRDDAAGVRAGGEWRVNEVLVFRAGYDSRYDLAGGLSGGLGFVVRQMEARFFPVGRLSIDYSFTSSGDLAQGKNMGGVHNISLTARMGDR